MDGDAHVAATYTLCMLMLRDAGIQFNADTQAGVDVKVIFTSRRKQVVFTKASDVN